MREIIKNQLLKCTYANLNNFNPETNTFYIPKYIQFFERISIGFNR